MSLVWSTGDCRGGLGEGVLSVEAPVLVRIADAVGTPVYVYDADAIRQRWMMLTTALAPVPHRLHYSVKANSNLAVLNLVRELGGGVDIVSGGELARVYRAGFQPADVVYSGVGKTREELQDAVRAGVRLVNLESVAEFEVLAGLVGRDADPVRVGIRVNPDVTAETHPYTRTGAAGVKFGVPLDTVTSLAGAVQECTGLCLVSIGMHLGSQIWDPASYHQGVDRLAGLVDGLRSSGLTSLEAFDVGGGLAVAYDDGERAMDPTAFAKVVNAAHEATGLTVLVEPGRFLVGQAGVLLTQALYGKHSGGWDFLIVDAGMNDFVRPSYYQARHRIRVIRPSPRPIPADTFHVVGPICESGDFLGLDRVLPGAGPGALLAVEGAGAYGFVMGSSYNSRPRPPEVLVDGPTVGIIRQRQTTQDLWDGESVQPVPLGP